MVEVNQLISLHMGGSKSRLEANRLKKEVAHLRAIADITDRVSGSNAVYYETFDKTNDMSVGKIDLARVEGCTLHSNEQEEIVLVAKAELGVNAFNCFKVGQEVTIVDTTLNVKHITTIIRIGEDAQRSYIRFATPKDITLTSVFTVCRSMAIIKEGNLHLDPPDMLEHDIRLNIDLEGQDLKAYTLITWIEQETKMTIESYTPTIEDTYIPPIME